MLAVKNKGGGRGREAIAKKEGSCYVLEKEGGKGSRNFPMASLWFSEEFDVPSHHKGGCDNAIQREGERERLFFLSLLLSSLLVSPASARYALKKSQKRQSGSSFFKKRPLS